MQLLEDIQALRQRQWDYKGPLVPVLDTSGEDISASCGYTPFLPHELRCFPDQRAHEAMRALFQRFHSEGLPASIDPDQYGAGGWTIFRRNQSHINKPYSDASGSDNRLQSAPGGTGTLGRCPHCCKESELVKVQLVSEATGVVFTKTGTHDIHVKDYRNHSPPARAVQAKAVDLPVLKLSPQTKDSQWSCLQPYYRPKH